MFTQSTSKKSAPLSTILSRRKEIHSMSANSTAMHLASVCEEVGFTALDTSSDHCNA
jgi:hypothetical protein